MSDVVGVKNVIFFFSLCRSLHNQLLQEGPSESFVKKRVDLLKTQVVQLERQVARHNDHNYYYYQYGYNDTQLFSTCTLCSDSAAHSSTQQPDRANGGPTSHAGVSAGLTRVRSLVSCNFMDFVFINLVPRILILYILLHVYV